MCLRTGFRVYVAANWATSYQSMILGARYAGVEVSVIHVGLPPHGLAVHFKKTFTEVKGRGFVLTVMFCHYLNEHSDHRFVLNWLHPLSLLYRNGD